MIVSGKKVLAIDKVNVGDSLSGDGVFDLLNIDTTWLKNNVLNNYATSVDVTRTFENYYTKNHIDNTFLTTSGAESLYQPLGDYLIPSDLDDYYTKNEINNGYYNKSEIDSITSGINNNIDEKYNNFLNFESLVEDGWYFEIQSSDSVKVDYSFQYNQNIQNPDGTYSTRRRKIYKLKAVIGAQEVNSVYPIINTENGLAIDPNMLEYPFSSGSDVTAELIEGASLYQYYVKIKPSILDALQDKLIVGDNISIEDNVISAKDTTYSAGDGIDIDDGVISINDSYVGDIVENNFVTNLENYVTSEENDVVQEKLIAGDNISIEDNVISAKDTTYSAGDGISIADGVISSNVVNEYELPIASVTELGGVKIGDGIDIDYGVISINDSYVGDIVENNFVTNLENYVTSEENDVVQEKLIAGDGISIDDGVISSTVKFDEYELPTASESVLGGVKVGDNLNIDQDGVLSAVDTKYTLPTATETTLGGVKIGEGIIVDEHGEISVEADMGFIKAKRTDFTITKTNENLLTGLTVSSVQNRFLIQDGYLYVRSHTSNDNNGVGIFSLSVSVNLSQDTREGFNYLNKIELVGGEVVDELILSSENYFNSEVGKNQLDVTTTVRKLTSNNSVEVNGFMYHKYELIWKGDYIQDSNQKVDLTISCVEEAKGVLGSALEVSEEFKQFIDTLNSRIISNMDFGAIDDIYQHSNGGGNNSRGIGTLFIPSMNMTLGTNTQISVVAGQTSGSNIIFAIYEVELLANNSTKLHWVANTNRVNSLGNSWNRFYLTELKENAMLKSDKLYYTMVFTENLNDLHIAGNKIINTGSKMTNSSMNPKFIISVPFDGNTTSENLKNVYGTIENESIEGYLNRIFMSLTNGKAPSTAMVLLINSPNTGDFSVATKYGTFTAVKVSEYPYFDTTVTHKLSISDVTFSTGESLSGTSTVRGLFVGVESWGTSNTYNNTSSLFYDCTNLRGIPSSWEGLGSLNAAYYMFSYCTSLTSIPSSWEGLGALTNAGHMFDSCTSLSSIPDSWEGLASLNAAYYMFSYCTSLTSIPSSLEGLGALANAGNMFDSCTSLSSIPDSWEGLASLNAAYYMFSGCTSLTSIPNSWEGLGTLTDANYMFSGCTSLTSIPDSWEGLGALTESNNMFSGCTSLTNCGTTFTGLAKAINVRSLFDGCTGMQGDIHALYVYLSTKPISVSYYIRCFRNCTQAVGYDLIPASWK